MRRLAAGVAVGMLLGLLPGVAHASWSPLRRLENPDWQASGGVASAVARDGRVVVAWSASPPTTDPDAATPRDVVHVRRISPTGSLGKIQTLSTWESGDPSHISVAVDADGDALVAWQSADRYNNMNPQVWARRLSWSGEAGPLVRVSPRDDAGSQPAVALTPRGRGAITYEQESNHWMLYRFSRDSRVRHPVPLLQAASGWPRLVATDGGDFVTASWSSSDRDVWGYRLRPDNRLLVRNVSEATSVGAGLAGLGVDRHGTAYFTYIGSRYLDGSKASLFVRPWSSSGRFGQARRMTPRSHTLLRATSSTDRQGDTVVGWSHQVADTALVEGYSRIRRRDGSLGAVHKIGPMPPMDPYAPFYLQAPMVPVDDDGDGVVLWASRKSGEYPVAWARRLRRDGTVGAKVKLRDHASPAPSVVTPKGRARVLISAPAMLWLRSGP